MARKRRKRKRQREGNQNEKLSFHDFARMMSSANTYERRGGKLRQRRQGDNGF